MNVKFSKEIKVGSLALVSFVLLYFGFNYLKGTDMFSPTRKYFVLYKGLDGLTVSNMVQLNGFKVGQVSKIDILQNRANLMLVTLDIEDYLELSDSTFAILSDNGLLGGKYINLNIKKGNKILQNNDTLRPKIQEGMMATFADKASPIVGSAEMTLTTLNLLMKEYQGMGASIKSLINNSDQMMANTNQLIVSNQSKMGQMMDNVNKLSASLVETEKEIKPLLKKMNTFADSLNNAKLAATVNSANQSMKELNKMLVAINSGKGSMGKIIYNDSLYQNLNKTILTLDKVLKDFQENPNHYLAPLGKKKKN